MAGKGTKSKDEYSPLLEEGLHPMSTDDLRSLVVDGFSKSLRRRMLWDNFIEVVDLLTASGLTCEIWVDGSFLTKKIDPDDVDFVVDVPADQYDNLTQAQGDILNKLVGQEFYQDKHLHSYLMLKAPLGHNLFHLSRDGHARWERDFGYAYVSKEPKGIAVVGVTP